MQSAICPTGLLLLLLLRKGRQAGKDRLVEGGVGLNHPHELIIEQDELVLAVGTVAVAHRQVVAVRKWSHAPPPKLGEPLLFGLLGDRRKDHLLELGGPLQMRAGDEGEFDQPLAETAGVIAHLRLDEFLLHIVHTNGADHVGGGSGGRGRCFFVRQPVDEPAQPQAYGRVRLRLVDPRHLPHNQLVLPALRGDIEPLQSRKLIDDAEEVLVRA